ncbi:M4 family metallopeptidase [Luteimonas panaciterrae]|uniref:M4 family metallopeptidase n=1 Tax=Luteimonas panaciterrae TaxID=363885 RepID=UPI001CFA9C9A|nr:M4 family metallopeptidase [Luteimonas panaciterrae]
MSMKKNILTASIALTMAGVAGIVAYSSDVLSTNGGNVSTRADVVSKLSAGEQHTAMAQVPGNQQGILLTVEAKKQAAIVRAENMLREQKIAKAAAAGRTASNAALAAESYQAKDVIVESDGSEYVRMDRKYRGLPVEGGDMVVHSKNGQFLSTTNTLDLIVPDAQSLASDPLPSITARQAIDLASRNFKTEALNKPTTEMVYFAKDNQPTLAYQVHLSGLGDDGIPVDDLIYVDANNGSYLGRRSNVLALAAEGSAFTLNRGKVSISTSQVTAAENPSGAGFVLMDETRGNGQTKDFGGKDTSDLALMAAIGAAALKIDALETKPFFDTDNLWGDNQVDLTQRIGAEVHYGIAKTWDYYKRQHDRSGIYDDGKGVTAIANLSSMTHILEGGSIERTNAFWNSQLKTMFYLNGDAGVSNPLVALDVAGHEMSHGVASATANFLSSGDAAGLNEANSDINGTLVEFFDNNSKDPPDYLIGESVRVDGKPFRYMFKPSLDTRSGTYHDKPYTLASYDCYPDVGFDYSVTDEVGKAKVDSHFTSGIGNHFFYLLSEGSKVPASHRKSLTKADLVCNGSTSLVAITNKTAGQIWYRALRLHMTSQTDYPKAREATQKAAAELQDRGLLTAKQSNAVACAWDAVNVPLPQGSTEAQCR